MANFVHNEKNTSDGNIKLHILIILKMILETNTNTYQNNRVNIIKKYTYTNLIFDVIKISCVYDAHTLYAPPINLFQYQRFIALYKFLTKDLISLNILDPFTCFCFVLLRSILINGFDLRSKQKVIKIDQCDLNENKFSLEKKKKRGEMRLHTRTHAHIAYIQQSDQWQVQRAQISYQILNTQVEIFIYSPTMELGSLCVVATKYIKTCSPP